MVPEKTLLVVEDLWLGFPEKGRVDTCILRGVDFGIRYGEILGLMGASGCGKTMTALTILGLADRMGARVMKGRVRFPMADGVEVEKDILAIPEEERISLRGRKLAYISQNPLAALNPVVPVGKQLQQTIAFYRGFKGGISPSQRQWLAEESRQVLQFCGLAKEKGIEGKYPNQLSVGMCQRAAIGLAICGRPELLIADEPTASLDADSRDWVMENLCRLRDQLSMSMLLITHQEKLSRTAADRVLRMEEGRVEEV